MNFYLQTNINGKKSSQVSYFVIKNYHTVNTVIHNTGNDYQLPGIRATDLFARQIQASILQEF